MNYIKIFASLLGVLAWGNVQAQNKQVYRVQWPSLDGKTVSMSDYAGNAILVWLANGPGMEPAFLKQLDSLAAVYQSGLVVMVLPCKDCGPLPADNDLLKLTETYAPNISVLGKPALTATGLGRSQHPLVYWLTHRTENKHFDLETVQPNSAFLISKEGTIVGHYDAIKDFRNAFWTRALQRVAR